MNILLLEDDVALNRAIKKVLELNNHIVSTFFDGNDVLEAFDKNFDLYIFDINVPNINGLELLSLLYNKNKNSKIIMITSNADSYSLEKAYELGCIDYLTKPFHLAELKIKVEKLDILKKDLLSSLKIKENQSLSKKEKQFISLLLDNKRKIVSYEMIDENVYEGKNMSMDGLRSLVRRLRAKLHEDIIENIPEEGYKISDKTLL
ncbi:MAG: response regulator transcription factor [Campylobacteraceae bacterium]|nr:response regulator transcription factor [Campylobacteraceae bacterium]